MIFFNKNVNGVRSLLGMLYRVVLCFALFSIKPFLLQLIAEELQCVETC